MTRGWMRHQHAGAATKRLCGAAITAAAPDDGLAGTFAGRRNRNRAAEA